MASRTFIPIVLTAMLSSSALTISAQQEGTTKTPAQAQKPAQPQLDADRLPLDLQRLERQLRSGAERQDWDGFKLRYMVEVYGNAPRLQFFEPKDVLPSGPIPYGVPTHKEMIEVMTPQEHRSPVMDFSGLMRWFQEKMK